MGGGVEDLSGVYEMMASGGLDPSITTTTFDKINEGLDLLTQGKVQGRMAVDMQDGI
ncbi:MAG: hypothetical protein ACQEXN_12365 [Actinomycetota bacterium]